MDYVMDALRGLDVEELIVVTGHLKEQVERYVTTHYPIPARFVEQQTLDGTAGPPDPARPDVGGPGPILFVGTPVGADPGAGRHGDADAVICGKEVEEYRR